VKFSKRIPWPHRFQKNRVTISPLACFVALSILQIKLLTESLCSPEDRPGARKDRLPPAPAAPAALLLTDKSLSSPARWCKWCAWSPSVIGEPTGRRVCSGLTAVAAFSAVEIRHGTHPDYWKFKYEPKRRTRTNR
jgi:hypothetical protein